ncbi:MAG: bifunctional lysylphosphatidylglycerol synthetase/lysine--tRNA ligase LysX [Mycobacteriales bacterium]
MERQARGIWRRVLDAVPAWAFWYYRLAGLISIVTWLSGTIRGWFDTSPFTVLYILGWSPSLTWGVLLLMLASGLRRRKRMAWRIAVFLWLPSVVIAAVALVADLGGDILLSAGIVAVLFVPLVAARRRFFALPDPANRRHALAVIGSAVALLAALGATLVHWTDRDPKGTFAGEIGYSLLQSLAGAGITGENASVSVPEWVDTILGLVGTAMLLLTVWVLTRPQRRAPHLPPADERRLRALLLEHGDQDSLGYFAVRRDKNVIFSASGKAAIAYRVVGAVSLASGDPIGDPEAWPGAISAWLAEARGHAWVAGVLGASEEGAAAYTRAGLDALELGDEAVLDLGCFTLEGRAMRPVRQAANRVERAGYTVRVRRHGDIPPEEMAEIVALADRWRDGETERGFSMALGRLGDPADADCVAVQAFDADGRQRGLLSFVPWGAHGLSLDLMRRDRDAENGLNEYMVAKLAEHGGAIGVTQVSLNFAVLRDVFDRGARIGAGPVLRLLRRVLVILSRWWQLESLYLANAKYHPEWRPRFVGFRRPRDLARIAIAAGRAEGFLPTLRTPKLADASYPPAGEVLPEVPVAAEVAAGEGGADRLTEQERVRRDKRDKLVAAGLEPYPVGYPRTTTAAELRTRHGDLPPDSHTGERVGIAGRVMLARDSGRLCFATVRDETGEIQVMLSRDTTGEAALALWKSTVDLGDQVGVTGEVITSRRGELSVLADEWALTAKCLRPLPDKHAGLHDPEARVRQRYVDLLVNPESRQLLRARGAMVGALRDELSGRGFLEVETPMLHPVHGGATARPFVTRVNAYDMPLYLRIAPELYLKRLLVGGMGRVFELNRNFRNEGVDATHNPEFTMLEAYEPYGDYDTMAALTRELVLTAARAALGGTVVTRDGAEYDLAAPWRTVTLYGAVSEALGEEITPDTPLDALRRCADGHGVRVADGMGPGAVAQELYEGLVEHTLVTPTFVRDWPTETSPLTRPHRDDPRLAEKWDLIVFGMELATAYSELVDPVEQRRRLTEQSLRAAGGDPEAMQLDEDFLRALEYGMPPSGGMGMGVDRLLIAFTGRSIRETIAFPLVKPG